MTTLAEHLTLIRQRSNWIHAKQSEYDAQRQLVRLAEAGGTGALRAAADALVPMARELDSAAERLYLALVPALQAANSPVAGQRADQIEELRQLTTGAVRQWATAQAALQEYRGGPMNVAPVHVPAWQAYTVGPTGLVGFARQTGQTVTEIGRAAKEAAGTAAEEVGQRVARGAITEAEAAAKEQRDQIIQGVGIGLVVLAALWLLKK